MANYLLKSHIADVNPLINYSHMLLYTCVSFVIVITSVKIYTFYRFVIGFFFFNILIGIIYESGGLVALNEAKYIRLSSIAFPLTLYGCARLSHLP